MTTCRSCDAAVVFVPSAKSGKPMILDAEPTKGVVLFAGEVLAPTSAPVVNGVLNVAPGDGKAFVVDVYTDHHATCPNAEDWR